MNNEQESINIRASRHSRPRKKFSYSLFIIITMAVRFQNKFLSIYLGDSSCNSQNQGLLCCFSSAQVQTSFFVFLVVTNDNYIIIFNLFTGVIVFITTSNCFITIVFTISNFFITIVVFTISTCLNTIVVFITNCNCFITNFVFTSIRTSKFTEHIFIQIMS